MRWVIDGMNVIGSRPDGWWRDREGAKERLARDLRAFRAEMRAEDADTEVELFLDGRPSGRVRGAAGHLEVRFAGGGRDAADDAIVQRIEADPEPGLILVVTSDWDLTRRATEAGAQVRPASEFRRRLDALTP